MPTVTLEEASLISTGTTASRSLANRFKDHANVLDYGAVGDGVTDDRAAILAACNANNAVFFPGNRTYVVNGFLPMRSNSRWYGPAGSGDASSAVAMSPAKLWFTGSSGGGAIRNNNPAAKLSHSGISDMVIGVATTATYDYMMDIVHMVGFRMDNVRFHSENTNIGGIRSSRLSGDEAASWVNNWTQVEVYIPRANAHYNLDLNTSDSAILGGNFTGGKGAIVRGPGAVKFMGTRLDITNTSGAGLTIQAYNDQAYTGYFAVIGCQIEENHGYGILIDADANETTKQRNIMAVIQGCQFRNSTGVQFSPAIADICLRNAVVSDSTGIVNIVDGVQHRDLMLLDDPADTGVMHGPVITGNTFTIPEDDQYTITKHIEYDPLRWPGIVIANNIHRRQTGHSDLIGTGRSAQPVLLLDQSTTQVANSAATTGTDIPLATYTLPGRTLRAGDIIEIEADWSFDGTTNNKIFRVTFGGTIYTGLVVATATILNTRTLTRILITGLATQKGLPANYAGSGNATGTAVTSAVDTTADVNIVFSIQRATASEALKLEGYSIKLLRKAL